MAGTSTPWDDEEDDDDVTTVGVVPTPGTAVDDDNDNDDRLETTDMMQMYVLFIPRPSFRAKEVVGVGAMRCEAMRCEAPRSDEERDEPRRSRRGAMGLGIGGRKKSYPDGVLEELVLE